MVIIISGDIRRRSSRGGGADGARLLVQAELSQRALELLALPDDGQARLILDVGCGSCLSGDAITEAGHTWLVGPTSDSLLFLTLSLSRETPLQT